MFLLLKWESISSKVRCFRENEEAQMIPCDQRMVMGWWSQPHQSWRRWRRVKGQRSHWGHPRRRNRGQWWFKNIWDLLVSWIRWRFLQKERCWTFRWDIDVISNLIEWVLCLCLPRGWTCQLQLLIDNYHQFLHWKGTWRGMEIDDQEEWKVSFPKSSGISWWNSYFWFWMKNHSPNRWWEWLMEKLLIDEWSDEGTCSRCDCYFFINHSSISSFLINFHFQNLIFWRWLQRVATSM